LCCLDREGEWLRKSTPPSIWCLEHLPDVPGVRGTRAIEHLDTGGTESRRLAAVEANGSALHAGVSFLGFDNHRLQVAVRIQGQTGGKRRPIGHDIDEISIRCAGNFSGNVPAGFAPTATDGVRCQSRAGAHVKTITIAGAADIQLKIILLLQHVISCPAPDWLDRAIRKINRTASRPLTR